MTRRRLLLLLFPALLFVREARAAGPEARRGGKIRIGLAVKVPASAVRVDKKKNMVNGRRYRGELKVIQLGKGLVTVVNALEMEDYVRGVVSREMSHSWPPEALKCQAVVARSYALANLGRFAKDGYDLCATAACQVYGGMDAEHPATDKAVESTRGQVVAYKGRPVSAVFHSCCGGETDDSSDVWRGTRTPYLRHARCRWCRESPHYQWTAEIPGVELSRRLAAAGRDVGAVSSIRVVSRTRAGRAYEVRVAGEKGAATLQANAFRLIVGARTLRSTFWSGLSEKGGSWRFNGRGWGHGVGLCQWCARATALQGYKYKEILAYFYRNTKVRQVDG